MCSHEMGEHLEDQTGDVDMTNSEMAFDNLTILKEISNIVDLVRTEDFLEILPKSKLRRVKWVPMLNYMKQGILDSMILELNAMWKYEDMPQKLEILKKQKEKFGDVDKVVWRPQLGDVKAQLKANDVANLQKQKLLLESLSKEYDSRVSKLKKTVCAKRGYLKALQTDIQKYQKKNEDIISQINEKLENHEQSARAITPVNMDVEQEKWLDTDFEIAK